MTRLTIISDARDFAQPIQNGLMGLFEANIVGRRDIVTAHPCKITFADIDLRDNSGFPDLRRWVRRCPKGRIVVFAVDGTSRRQVAQAYALGATDVLTRPVRTKSLIKKLVGETGSLVAEASSADLANAGAGIAMGIDALQSIFASACLGADFDRDKLDQAGEAVARQIEADGLKPWIDNVRKHHSQTYQHCLIVTGVAVAFGRQLGFSASDCKMLALAGLLHDIGKARIPISILEKPGALDPDEIAVMKLHPEFGVESLDSIAGLQPDMLDMILHHHEYLDGSGYPHGLRADDLSDLVRLMTISDMFGALLERRSYKPPMSGAAAYSVLEEMGVKLDADLVREFRPIALGQPS